MAVSKSSKPLTSDTNPANYIEFFPDGNSFTINQQRISLLGMNVIILLLHFLFLLHNCCYRERRFVATDWSMVAIALGSMPCSYTPWFGLYTSYTTLSINRLETYTLPFRKSKKHQTAHEGLPRRSTNSFTN